jgi:4-aminobutyrate aminotransferase
VPPPSFHAELTRIAKQHGILYIVDEVQSGMGRTGKMFAIEHWGVEPDIICLAKGLASGMPLGAIIATSEIMSWPPGAHASTFGGNPVSCVAALETIALLEEELMENAARVGEHLIGRLGELLERFDQVGEVRGKGLMVGMELVADRASREPNAKLRDAVVHACFHRGLLLLGCGVSTIRFCPPLVVTAEQCDTAVGIIEDVLRELS